MVQPEQADPHLGSAHRRAMPERISSGASSASPVGGIARPVPIGGEIGCGPMNLRLDFKRVCEKSSRRETTEHLGAGGDCDQGL
jgi:hypothetical protein